MQPDQDSPTRQRKRKNYIQQWMEYRGLKPKDLQEATGAGKDLEWKWRNKDNFPTEEYLSLLLELLATDRESLFHPAPGKPDEGRNGAFISLASPEPELPKAGFTGRVGAGGSAINVEMDPSDAARTLPVIAGKTDVLRIAELDGDSLGALFNRWMVVYGPPVLFKGNLPYGQLCLVLTTDDEMTVKWLEKTRKRGVRLVDAAGNTYRDGVELQWAAPVLGMRPQ